MRTWQHTTAPLVLFALGVLVQGTDASIFTTTIKVCLYDGAGCEHSPSDHYCSEERDTMEAGKSSSPWDIDIGDCDQGCFDIGIDYGEADCDDDDIKSMLSTCQVGVSPDNNGAPVATSFECSDNKSLGVGGIVGGSVAAMIGRSVLPSPLSWSARPQGRPPCMIKTALAPSVPSDATRRDKYVWSVSS